MTDPDIRCGHCGKLLARGIAITLHIRCPRCGADNYMRAASPNLEGPEPQKGASHASPPDNPAD